MIMGSSLSTTGVGGGGVGRMLGVSGGSRATSPNSSVQRDWMASISLGGASCGINDSVGSSYFRDWDGMMLEMEGFSDPLAACVGHEDSNAMIVIRGMQ
jgi:hypothetical protein